MACASAVRLLASCPRNTDSLVACHDRKETAYVGESGGRHRVGIGGLFRRWVVGDVVVVVAAFEVRKSLASCGYFVLGSKSCSSHHPLAGREERIELHVRTLRSACTRACHCEAFHVDRTSTPTLPQVVAQCDRIAIPSAIIQSTRHWLHHVRARPATRRSHCKTFPSSTPTR